MDMSQGQALGHVWRAVSLRSDLRGARRELDAHGLGLALAPVRDLDRVARVVGIDRQLHAFRRLDLLAADRRDHVAAGRVLRALDHLLAGRPLQAGPLSLRPGPYLRYLHAFGEVEIVRNRRRDFLDGDAEIGVLDLAVRDQRVGDRANRVRWDREPDADVGAGLACDLRVDADHLSGRVEEGAAGVAVIDCGVSLDRVVDRELVQRLDLAVERAHDAARDGLLETERAANRNDRVTDLHARRVPEADRMEDRRRRVDLDHGEVRRRVGADDRSVV